VQPLINPGSFEKKYIQEHTNSHPQITFRTAENLVSDPQWSRNLRLGTAAPDSQSSVDKGVYLGSCE